MSEFAQASYFAGIMRTELVEARKAAKEAQRRWSTRRVSDNTEIPEHVVRLKRRVREANRVLKALEKRSQAFNRLRWWGRNHSTGGVEVVADLPASGFKPP